MVLLEIPWSPRTPFLTGRLWCHHGDYGLDSSLCHQKQNGVWHYSFVRMNEVVKELRKFLRVTETEQYIQKGLPSGQQRSN